MENPMKKQIKYWQIRISDHKLHIRCKEIYITLYKSNKGTYINNSK